MKRNILLIALALLVSGSAFATNKEAAKSAASKWTDHVKMYGFVRTYFAFDTRESHAGSDDFFYYLPKAPKLGADGVDLMEYPSFRFAALTSRIGFDIKGFQFEGFKLGGKIEADFNAGLSGNTGTAQLRLRQAYATLAKKGHSLKVGQAWHPMAADIPDIFSLEAGAPFGPFNRSPQVNYDYAFKLDEDSKLSLTAAALWQMQYISVGPEGNSANYIKYSCVPEFYFGVNFLGENGLVRLGVDVLSIKPRKDDGLKKVSDRLTTVNAFMYMQYKVKNFTTKAKVTYTQDGSHLNMVGGYGVSNILTNGSWEYTPTNTASLWMSFSYRHKNWQPQLFLGYLENMGTDKEIRNNILGNTYFWEKNNASSLNCAFRLQPEIIYNLGKFQFGLEYMMTLAEYGKSDEFKKPLESLGAFQEVINHRVQALVKFNF